VRLTATADADTDAATVPALDRGERVVSGDAARGCESATGNSIVIDCRIECERLRRWRRFALGEQTALSLSFSPPAESKVASADAIRSERAAGAGAAVGGSMFLGGWRRAGGDVGLLVASGGSGGNARSGSSCGGLVVVVVVVVSGGGDVDAEDRGDGWAPSERVRGWLMPLSPSAGVTTTTSTAALATAIASLAELESLSLSLSLSLRRPDGWWCSSAGSGTSSFGGNGGGMAFASDGDSAMADRILSVLLLLLLVDGAAVTARSLRDTSQRLRRSASESRSAVALLCGTATSVGERSVSLAGRRSTRICASELRRTTGMRHADTGRGGSLAR